MTVRICPSCGVNELPPRYRKCEDCVRGAPPPKELASSAVYVPSEKSLMVPTAKMREEPRRPVNLSCGCVIEIDGRLWQPEETTCTTHGAAWMMGVVRG